jgi:predicted DNA-binding transcriptional regulator YafY
MEDLVEACNLAIFEFSGITDGVKKRQIFEDIKFMESDQGFRIPLVRSREKHKVFFHYEDRNFSINNSPIRPDEQAQLKEAILTLSRFKGLPQFEWVNEIAARLDSGLGLSGPSNNIIEFEQNQYLAGLEYLTPVYHAIQFGEVLHIKYQSFRQETAEIIVFHPYYLKQFNNRWFVFGRNHKNHSIQNLALDRILSVQKGQEKFEPNKEIDFADYFEDIVGVSLISDKKPEMVLLKISNQLYPYIQTKPIHGSQKVKEKLENHTVISLELIPNFELESILLSHGEGVEILGPASLRERIQNRLEKAKMNYQ